MQSFFDRLPKPFFVLAPMEDVTDAAFRKHIASYKAANITFTEFTSADGLVLAPEIGRKSILKKLEFTEGERPIIAQLFSAVPERMEKAAAMCAKLGFDGIDINMGCPVGKIVDTGCGAAMIKTPDLAIEIVRAARQGAPNLPISVKTRVGYSRDEEMEAWIPTLLKENLAMLTLHARTRNDMSAVPARWELVERAVEMRNEIAPQTKIVGNGDALDIPDARKKAEESGADGVMLGRAIYGNPWLFLDRPTPPTQHERIESLIQHIQLFEDIMIPYSNPAVMKKHFKAYISGFDGAKELRVRLMEAETLSDARSILQDAIIAS